jgi:hypothetical protein
VVEPQAAAPLTAPEPRPARVLRDAEGGESHAPAFLQAPTPRRDVAEADEAAVKRPRRRRSSGPATSETEEA